MVDWLTVVIKVDHKNGVLGGFRTFLDEKRNMKSEFTTFAKLEGTYDSRMMVKSQNEVLDTSTGEVVYTELYFSGNPVKVLQGHNIFGTDDIHGLVFAMVEKAIHFFAVDIDIKTIHVDDIKLVKVDINYSFRLKNEKQVEMWINSAERTASLPYAGRGVLKSTTSLVFSESSKHYRFKFYGKHQELKAHLKKRNKLPAKFYEFTKSILRAELEAKRILKKNGLSNLSKWTLETPRKLFNEYLSSMNISDNLIIPDEKLHDLTPSAQAVYRLWLDGYDMKTMYKNASTFYLWRRKLLKQINVDIALANKNQRASTNNVIPLIQYITAEPMTIEDIPDDLKTEQYLFQPKAHQRFCA